MDGFPVVVCKDGMLRLDEVQPAGKKPMNGKVFLNGARNWEGFNIMRILVFGAGAIGSYIGGSLALAGEDVVFFEREDVAAQLRKTGLKFGLPDGEKIIPEPKIYTSLQEVFQTGKFDLSVLAVKGFDTAAVLETLKPFIDQIPPILCLQNGVENEPLIAGVLGEERVIRGTVTTAIGRRGLGDIVVERFRGHGNRPESSVIHFSFGSLQPGWSGYVGI